jgi:hypothetical protein
MDKKQRCFCKTPAFPCLAVVLLVLGTAALAFAYQGVPWGSSFPVIEKRFPSIVFEDEDAFQVTTFSVSPPEAGLAGLEIKFFKNRLTSVIHKYDEPLTAFMDEAYLRKYFPALGKRIKIDQRKIPTARGMTDTTLWDYGEVLVFFQTYPAAAHEDENHPLNLVKFVYKPLFNELKAYITNNPDGDPDILEDDFDAVAF